jgi:ATP-dependent exoDNAse (exonuclease V) beta subunit
VRRLVRLGGDRDLRQLPLAAQGLDAISLMTIHGAKGLEFKVVHLPRLNANTLPRTPPEARCPPPDGMVEGICGTAREIFRTEQKIEQECLF